MEIISSFKLLIDLFHAISLFLYPLKQGSDRPGKPGKVRELVNASGKSGKTWKTQ